MHQISVAPESDLTTALSQFEQQFHYPLGPERYFRISHGQDYPSFFRAIGEARCFVAERNGVVLGVVGAAIRTLLLPNKQRSTVVYFGDVKIDPKVRGGRTLLLLSKVVKEWVGVRANAAYCASLLG